MSALYSIESIRQIESLAYAEGIDTEISLMYRAGEAAFRALFDHWPNRTQPKSMLVFAGSGNNAGDGFVLARLAKEAGLVVRVLTLSPMHTYHTPAKETAQACIDAGVLCQEYTGQLDLDPSVDVIVDALLGIGIKRDVVGRYAGLIEQINTVSQPVISLDVPSGLDANTGNVMGIAVQATITITFIAWKLGLFTNKGPDQCGQLICDDLQLPKSLFSRVASTDLAPSAILMNWTTLQAQCFRRKRDSHKGFYGHLLIIGGDYGMGGAVRLAAEAALRVGAGLVSVATHAEHVVLVSSNCPEVMCHQVRFAEELSPLLAKATVVVIGPGLGKIAWARTLLSIVLAHDHPILLDADALNLISENPARSDRWVLTPHPGEASRLLGTSVSTIQADRFASAKALQQKYGGVIVLKGVGSLVQAAADEPSRLCPAGNPGMASGGMGDVLSGVIGGLMAQKFSLSLAAELGVMLHALAADAAAEKNGERGLLARDLMPYLRCLVNAFPVKNQ